MKKFLLAMAIVTMFFSAETKPVNAQNKPYRLTDNIVVIASTENDSYGTGFFISPYGHVLTNEHVIKGGKFFQLCFQSIGSQDGVECYASDKLKVLATDSDLDLALLQLPQAVSYNGNNYLTLGNSDSSEIGDKISMFGYPESDLLSIKASNGQITGSNSVYLLTDAQILDGNSGSPVFNDQNEVIGIAEASFDFDKDGNETGIIISSDIAKDWLNSINFYPGGGSIILSMDRSFSVNFPGKPRFFSSIKETKAGKMTLNNYFYQKNKNEIFLVNYAYLSQEQFKELILKKSLKEILTGESTASIEEIRVDKQDQGILWKEKTTIGYFITGKIYFEKNKFYQIVAMKKGSYPDIQEADSFIRSFKLL